MGQSMHHQLQATRDVYCGNAWQWEDGALRESTADGLEKRLR
jgi:hypothetical protein